MDTQRLINKVAAGLRKMDIKPDYLLFLKYHVNDDSVWDTPYISNVPIIHTDEWLHSSDDKDCPFYPCWNQEGNHSGDVISFRRAYDEM